MTKGTGSGEVTLETVDILTPRCRVWGGHPGDCGRVTSGAGSGDCVGLTPFIWVRILYLETPYLFFASLGLARSGISSV